MLENKHTSEERQDFWVVLSAHLRFVIGNLQRDQSVEFEREPGMHCFL